MVTTKTPHVLPSLVAKFFLRLETYTRLQAVITGCVAPLVKSCLTDKDIPALLVSKSVDALTHSLATPPCLHRWKLQCPVSQSMTTIAVTTK